MGKLPQTAKTRVRMYLAAHQMTQAGLAKQLGITASHLSGILSRRETASLPIAVALEKLTRVPAREFIKNEARA